MLSAVGVAVLLIGGWFGGRLSYSYGVRVKDEQDQVGAHLIEGRGTTGSADSSSSVATSDEE